MSFIAVAIGGAAVVGAGAAIYSSNKMADASKQAAQTSANVQERMFEKSRADMEPWRQAGQGALYQMSDFMGIPTEGQPQTPQFGSFMDYFGAEDFQKDPGYDFRLQEGQKALERGAAASGGLFSGRTGKALTQYGQDYGSNEFMNAYNRWNTDRDRLYNRLSSVAGTGQTSAQQIGNWGMNTGQNVGNAYATGIQNAGVARASGYTGVANAANAGLNAWAQYRGMNQPPSYGSPNYGAPPPGAEYNQGMPYYNSAGW